MCQSSDVFLGLLLPGPIEADDLLNREDHEILFSVCHELASTNGGLALRNPAFIFENDHASIITAHDVIDSFCGLGCKGRHFVPRGEFWAPSHAHHVIAEIHRSGAFWCDLWIFIGDAPRLKNILRVLVPQWHQKFDAEQWTVFYEQPMILLQMSREGLPKTAGAHTTQ